MKAAEAKPASVATSQKANQPFFSRETEGNFFGESVKKESPFFKRASAYSINGKSVLQTKLTIGQPNDIYEKEADATADRVVQRLSKPNIQRKSSDFSLSFGEGRGEAVQKKCAHCEEEERREKKDKEDTVNKQINRKPIFESNAEPPDDDKNIQRKCAECEKEEKLQKKPDNSLSFGEGRGEVVQRKCAECEKEEGKTNPLDKAVGEPEPLEYYGKQELGALGTISQQKKKEEMPVQKKDKTGQSDSVDYFDSKLSSEMNNGGIAMSPDLQTTMQNSFGSDFTNIRIHNDGISHALNEQIHAKAFTHKNHIFFNKNQFEPDSVKGKHLLAHELTHTLQQAGSSPVSIQRKIGDGHDFVPTSRFSKNVILESVFDNERVVKKGDNGAHVTLIQQVLIARNYLLPTFGADGIFGDETQRAVRAFQQDVGLGVDGVVGFHTIDFLDKRDRNAEVSPPARPVVANTPFNTNNAIVQPGAVPSHALAGCVYGLTFPENVQVRIDLFNNAGVWQPVLSEVVGNYSLQPRLLPGQTEVTGPAGNTTAANYCAQITELNSLGNCPGAVPPATWYMLSAVLAHERIHATKFRTALIHPTVINPLETAIEGITRPVAGLSANPIIAEFFIRTDPAFVAALAAAQANWLARILVLVAGDHAAGGPTDTAEHGIVDPMVRRICRHAKANGWPACPPLCP